MRCPLHFSVQRVKCCWKGDRDLYYRTKIKAYNEKFHLPEEHVDTIVNMLKVSVAATHLSCTQRGLSCRPCMVHLVCLEGSRSDS